VEQQGKWAFEIRKASGESDFGSKFWQAQGPAKIFEAAWQLVEEAWAIKKRDPNELRLQRTAVHIGKARG
jgi:hypothetical protein